MRSEHGDVERGVHCRCDLDDDVDAVGEESLDLVSGIAAAVVDDMLRAGGLRELCLLVTAHRGDDTRARPAGELDRGVAHGAGAARDEHTPAGERADTEPPRSELGHGQAAVGGQRRDPEARADIVVEVAPGANAPLDVAVLAPHGTAAAYATDGGDSAELPVWELMRRNVRYQLVLVYTLPPETKAQAVADVSAAAAAGALAVGEAAGLPLHRFPLDRASDAHAATEGGAVGKVLIDVRS